MPKKAVPKSRANALIKVLGREDAGMFVEFMYKIPLDSGYPEGTVLDDKDLMPAFKNTKNVFFVALVDDKIVGAVSLDIGHGREKYGYHQEHIAEVHGEVLKEHRRAGIGSSLIDYAVEWAKKQGIRKIVTSTLATNKEAIAFYKKMGFDVEGTLKDSCKIRTKDGKEYFVDVVVMGRGLKSGLQKENRS